MNYLIEAKNIGLNYGAYRAVYDFNFSIKTGEIITIIGPVGCGKTSVIKLLSGITKPNYGTINKKQNLIIGYMPQEAKFNISIPIVVSEFLRLTGKATSWLETLYQKLDIERLLDRQIHALSSGELKLVLLARALAVQPNLLLLDEPICGMDINAQDRFYQLLDDIRKQYNCGIIMTSHDLHVVMRKSDYVICMNHHICCEGKPANVSQHPEFINLFGNSVSVYTHHHDHSHSLNERAIFHKED
jgi:zinc transport system ATP-binding protein